MLNASNTAPTAVNALLPQFSMLTPRERHVMLYIARGVPNKIIGDELGISRRTVEAHRARIFRKLNIRNAVELANYMWGKCPPYVITTLMADRPHQH